LNSTPSFVDANSDNENSTIFWTVKYPPTKTMVSLHSPMSGNLIDHDRGQRYHSAAGKSLALRAGKLCSRR
jgi:hypothetical protein